MGGYGSTRWTWERTRQDTAGLLRLDVHGLKRAGALQPGTVSTISWTRADGEPAGNIVTHIDRDGGRLTLDYCTRTTGVTDRTSRTIHVPLERTPCHYGGERVWFTCPGCQRRRAVLFSVGGLFRCRACHDLAYTSTRESALDRSYRRIRTLQQQLGESNSGVPAWTIPPKPTRMHWRTYDRLVRELQLELHRNGALFDQWIAEQRAILDRLERQNYGIRVPCHDLGCDLLTVEDFDDCRHTRAYALFAGVPWARR